jgi:hypothetical protein
VVCSGALFPFAKAKGNTVCSPKFPFALAKGCRGVCRVATNAIAAG